MIEKITLDYLTTKLTPIPVVMEEPKTKVSKFVLIEKTSGGETNRVEFATLAIKSYAASLYEAASLNESVKTAMRDLATLPTVASCKLNSDYNFTDTTEKRYRYQAVFNIHF